MQKLGVILSIIQIILAAVPILISVVYEYYIDMLVLTTLFVFFTLGIIFVLFFMQE